MDLIEEVRVRVELVGGCGPCRGVLTSWGGAWTVEAGTFWKFCMSKRKNMDP